MIRGVSRRVRSGLGASSAANREGLWALHPPKAGALSAVSPLLLSGSASSASTASSPSTSSLRELAVPMEVAEVAERRLRSRLSHAHDGSCTTVATASKMERSNQPPAMAASPIPVRK